MLILASTAANAAGTPVGTVIQNTATVSFDLAGTPTTINTNTTTVTVAERIDVVVTLQSTQQQVTPGETNRELLFTVTNTGNGDETFSLAINNTVAGNVFDPIAAVPAIYFDSDASGDLTAGDVAYTGSNDPLLAADASVDILLVNDIPGGVVDGDFGRSELTATSLTGTGPAGTTYAGQGDGGTDAVVGLTTGTASLFGEYVVSDAQVSVSKAQVVLDSFGGAQPLPGATITYTLTVEVTGTGTAAASVLRDAIPTYSSFVPNSIRLNSAALTDAVGDDAGELDTSGAPTVVVRLGDLTLASGVQTVEFQVTID